MPPKKRARTSKAKAKASHDTKEIMDEMTLSEQRVAARMAENARLAEHGPDDSAIIGRKGKYAIMRFKIHHPAFVHISIDYVPDTSSGPPYKMMSAGNLITLATPLVGEIDTDLFRTEKEKPTVTKDGEGDAWPSAWIEYIHAIIVIAAVRIIQVNKMNSILHDPPSDYILKVFTAKGVDGQPDAGSCTTTIFHTPQDMKGIVIPDELDMFLALAPLVYVADDTIDMTAVREGRARLSAVNKPGAIPVGSIGDRKCLPWVPAWEDLIIQGFIKYIQ